MQDLVQAQGDAIGMQAPVLQSLGDGLFDQWGWIGLMQLEDTDKLPDALAITLLGHQLG